MSESVSEVDALRVVDAAKSRLAIVEGEREIERSFVTGVRLAHAKAMVKAAERLLRDARDARDGKASRLDSLPDDPAR